MQYIYNIIKADYLQRTRSYSFLITLAVTIYVAYSFVPPNSASYTTLSAAGYKGVYNSAWVGYVSAIMTTVMLSFYGFLLVNSGIKKDIDTEVGLIIATTPLTNFKYLLIKQLSNYIVLLTITACSFIVSLLLFFIRGEGYPFILTDFFLPYLFFAIPALFIVASLAVVAEVFLSKRGILQYIMYLFLCGIAMGFINIKNNPHPTGVFDPFGLSLITSSITNQINTQFHENITEVSFGFIFNGHKTYKPFVWEGISWSGMFILSRFLWIGLSSVLIYLSAPFFHRFDFKQQKAKKKSKVQQHQVQINHVIINSAGINLALMPPLVFNYSILPFIKTELLLMVRQGNKWLWLLNAALWLTMFLVPLNIAYGYLLPILLFLQVTRLSELVIKEKTNRVHYFAYASYKPLWRMLPAQILAGVTLVITLALPVIVRSVFAFSNTSVFNIINGCILIVLLAVAMGILSGGKKLFEVVFFMLTYALINKVPIADYLGSLTHSNAIIYTLLILCFNVALIFISFLTRNYQARHL